MLVILLYDEHGKQISTYRQKYKTSKKNNTKKPEDKIHK